MAGLLGCRKSQRAACHSASRWGAGEPCPLWPYGMPGRFIAATLRDDTTVAGGVVVPGSGYRDATGPKLAAAGDGRVAKAAATKSNAAGMTVLQ